MSIIRVIAQQAMPGGRIQRLHLWKSPGAQVFEEVPLERGTFACRKEFRKVGYRIIAEMDPNKDSLKFIPSA